MNPFVFFLLFCVAACSGALIRWNFYKLGENFSISPIWATGFVNVLGSFALGFLFIYMEKFSMSSRTLVFMAFLGSLTTYSTFSLDTLQLIQGSSWKTLSLYWMGMQSLGLASCYLGWSWAQRLSSGS